MPPVQPSRPFALFKQQVHCWLTLTLAPAVNPGSYLAELLLSQALPSL